MQAHRGSYKTTAIIIVGAIWYLTFVNYDHTIGTLRKSDTEAQKIGRTVREHFEGPNLRVVYEYLFRIKSLKTSSWSNSSITLSVKKSHTPEGSFEARGKSTSITGTHWDVILPDDLVTLKDRVSQAERESTKEIIYELENNVLNPGGLICYSGTPWHKMDAWEKMPKPVQYPIGSIALPHVTPEYIKKLKSRTPASLYAANYELKHIASEKAEFSDPIYGPWPARSKKVTAWLDPSYSGADTTALCIYAESKEGTHHVRGFVWPEHVEQCYVKIINRLQKYNAGTLYVETNADKGYSKKDLSLKWTPVIGRNENANKHVKITSFIKKNWDKLLFADDMEEEDENLFIAQVLDYQEGLEPDDAPDAMASLLREMKIYDTSDILYTRFRM